VVCWNTRCIIILQKHGSRLNVQCHNSELSIILLWINYCKPHNDAIMIWLHLICLWRHVEPSTIAGCIFFLVIVPMSLSNTNLIECIIRQRSWCKFFFFFSMQCALNSKLILYNVYDQNLIVVVQIKWRPVFSNAH